MPRNGDGSSDNGPFDEAQKPIVHGEGSSDTAQTTHVSRADNTAAAPSHEKGAAVEGVNASGQGLTLPTKGDQGKGSDK